jgi:hypothetical protein
MSFCRFSSAPGSVRLTVSTNTAAILTPAIGGDRLNGREQLADILRLHEIDGLPDQVERAVIGREPGFSAPTPECGT